jgi:type I restriction enzyme S subunit
MNAERLLEHYERIVDAPDAIYQLRRFVLDLAVRGKLVPQDPNDEPVSELLKRIKIEKARLVKAGNIQKLPVLDHIDEDQMPFMLPPNWKWVLVGDVFDYDAGIKRGPSELIPDRWLLELEDIEKDTSTVLERLRVKDRDSQSTKSEFEIGDILYGKLRPYLNKVVVADEPGYSTTEIVAIRPFVKLSSEYCALAFRRPDYVAYVERLGRGTKMPRLRTPDAIAALFPLPPVAEQQRIVIKVNELLALCDELEIARRERDAIRERLTAASFTRLKTPDPKTFGGDLRFALDTLPVLTTRPEQITQLRETVLNLAVRGKLVAQNYDDEPASELLNRIAAEKAQLMEEKKIRRKAAQKPIHSEDEPFSIPKGWVWCRLGDLFNVVTDGSHHTPQYINSGVPFLSVKDVSTGNIIFHGVKYISEKQHAELCKRCRPENGDILLTKVGTTGIAVPINTEIQFSIFVSLALLKFSSTNLSQKYLCDLINSPFVRHQSSKNTQGIGNQNLVLRLINEFALPVPPLAEQHRIAAKVDELMVLCDQLEANLTSTDETRCQLLDALLAEALTPAAERELEAAE